MLIFSQVFLSVLVFVLLSLFVFVLFVYLVGVFLFLFYFALICFVFVQSLFTVTATIQTMMTSAGLNLFSASTVDSTAAVKAFVTDAIWKTVSDVTGAWVSRSFTP